MGSNNPILFMGDKEQDFYPGEVKDLVISTLKKGLSNVKQKTRRHDVVSDVIDTNDFQDFSKKKAKEADRLLKSYSRMTPKIRKGWKIWDLCFMTKENIIRQNIIMMIAIL